MLDKSRLRQAVNDYKAAFPTWIQDEIFKWKAVKWFNDHWDIDAPNFGEMFKTATDVKMTFGLLASMNHYPKGMIEGFSREVDDEAVRQMFVNLYDESKELTSRITDFQNEAKRLRVASGLAKWQNDYQDGNAITTYLWLRYPDQYYIYKFKELRAITDALHCDYRPKKGQELANITESMKIYDEISEYLRSDRELRTMLDSTLDTSCYYDPMMHTLAIDLGYYITQNGIWWPSDDEYPAPFTKNQWKELLSDPDTFTLSDLELVKRFYDIGGQASCAEIAAKYGNTAQHYNLQATRLCQRLAVKHNAPTMPEGQVGVYFPILFKGRPSRSGESGSYIWKLRDELKDAIAETDLSHVPLYDAASAKPNLPPETPKMDSDPTPEAPKYEKEDFEREVYMPGIYDRLVEMLEFNRNIILQGAPGTGKTFAAKRLAYAMTGAKDSNFIEMVQFHQNYSYEDFILGFRPNSDGGFDLVPGIFYRFCENALGDPEHKYFFIIDEINRGNLSKIFGELFMSIEKSHRNEPVTLAYGGKQFVVPDNLYIIGMMNTADRSIAMVDYALRRRFCFFTMEPAFDSPAFEKYMSGVSGALLKPVVRKLKELNKVIADDKSLGHGFKIGHSYLASLDKGREDRQIKDIVKYEIIPMLEEYWFDNEEELRKHKGELLGAIGEKLV